MSPFLQTWGQEEDFLSTFLPGPARRRTLGLPGGEEPEHCRLLRHRRPDWTSSGKADCTAWQEKEEEKEKTPLKAAELH